MKCPKCDSTSYRKNGRDRGRQRYLCKSCGKQFIEPASVSNGAVVDESAMTPLPHSELSAIATFEKPSENGQLPLTNQIQLATNIATQLADILSVKQPITSQTSIADSPGLAILLLDAENLKLDIKTEQFLGSLSSYPLQIKIAFANWKNSAMGNQDNELHKRGYQLVHVPSGASNADGKMISLGASIFLRYPTAKEIFVCSCDSLLLHLCNELQSQGLTVYRVLRKDENLVVENYATGENKHYSPVVGAEIPDFEGLMSQLKNLIAQEKNNLTDRLADLATISTLFQSRCQITLNDRSSSAKNNNGGIAKIEAVTPPIVVVQTAVVNEEKPPQSAKKKSKKKNYLKGSINSAAELEQILLELLKSIETEGNEKNILVATLGESFSQVYGKSVTSQLKELSLGSKLTTFLKSCTAFDVTDLGSRSRVAIAQPLQSEQKNSKETKLEVNIDSPAELEQVLLDLLKLMVSKDREKKIFVGELGGAFYQAYGKSVTSLVKELGFGSKLTTFLKSCAAFKVTDSGAKSRVAIAQP
ncbi:NYN domain-containing protein [Kamptonema sp. UHCC 0994]|uniref:IS1/IS1595 family N-terminal zinc-binding domain-containing protein n=1 Tax=Kamptonema sp. UHCC 0994 TaxID=3031329 RepID=UPI0023B8BA79|nr:NYN domain-containing protein [Kamptonema sp. UHCC 0994]MDF0551535.1 OST-HTH/LOTUS domain-containing protein [Kamptonema sp. UHCC 0994]